MITKTKIYTVTITAEGVFHAETEDEAIEDAKAEFLSVLKKSERDYVDKFVFKAEINKEMEQFKKDNEINENDGKNEESGVIPFF